MTNGRPSLLFVAPLLPAESRNGLAMRAGAFLDAFARDFAVTLLVVAVAGGAATVSRFVRQRTCRVVMPPLAGTLDPLWDLCMRVRDPEARAAALAAYPRPALCRHATTPFLDAARTALAGARFDAVHVMRSYLAPYAAPFLAGNLNAQPPFASIDLDDDEALTHRRLATMYEQMGRSDDARVEAAEACKYEHLEAQWLPRFQLRITCTATHAQSTAAAHPGGVAAVVPNTIALPWRAPRWRAPRWRASRNRILFVGNLSYVPNIEGVRNFVEATLPLLRARLPAEVTLRIVGSAPTPAVIALAEHPGVELVADPAHLATHYRWADLCVIPLTAGGGTRIKVLEAFAYGVPVVATPLGAEGIAAQDRVHLLLADPHDVLTAPHDVLTIPHDVLIDPHDAFAGACAELLSDAGLAATLSRSARRLVATRYSRAVGTRIIRETFAAAATRR